MKDQISHLANELSDYSQYHHLENGIKRIFKKLGIVKSKTIIKCGYYHKGTDKCTFYCNVDPEYNLFRKNLSVIVKPDHSAKRILRVLVEIGEDIFQKGENKDRWTRDDKTVFDKEEKAVLKDIIHYLRKRKKEAA